MAEIRCQQCSTSVTSAWKRDAPAKAIVCPRCQDRLPEPFREIEQWIFPCQAKRLQLTRRRIAVMLLLIFLTLGVVLVSIRHTPRTKDAVSLSTETSDGAMTDARPKPDVAVDTSAAPAISPDASEGRSAATPPSTDSATGKAPPAPAEPATGQPTGPAASPGPSAVTPDETVGAAQPPNGQTTVDRPHPVGLPAPSIPPCFFVRKSPVCCLATDPQRSLLAFAHEDGTVRFWDIEKGSETQQSLKSKNRAPLSVSLHPNGRLLALLFADGWELYDVASGSLQVSTPSTARLSAVAFSGDGRYLALGESKGGIMIRRLPDLTIVKERLGLDGILCLDWCDSRKQFVAASVDGMVRFWLPYPSPSPEQRRLPACLLGHSDWVSCLAQVASTGVLITGSWDRSVRAWDVRSGDMLMEFRGHGEKVSAVAASSDGQLVASGTEAGVVKTWDAATGAERYTFRGHHDRITGIVFVGDHWIVTASADGSARAWDATTGEEGLPPPTRASVQQQRPNDPRDTQVARYAAIIEEASALRTQKRYDVAATKYREAIQLRPRYAEPHYCLGECLLEHGAKLDAIKAFRTAVKLQPESGSYRYRLGVALLANGEQQQAVTVLKEARGLLPDLLPLRLCLGQALLRQEQHSDAAVEFEEAVRLSPQSPEAHRGLGIAYAQLQRWSMAESELRTAIDLDRKCDAYSDLIEVILASGSQHPRQAVSWAELARSLGVAIRQDTMEKLQRALSKAR